MKNRNGRVTMKCSQIIAYTLWYQKATYTNIFLKKLRTVKFETTVETNNKSISRQTTMVFDYLHQTILIR